MMERFSDSVFTGRRISMFLLGIGLFCAVAGTAVAIFATIGHLFYTQLCVVNSFGGLCPPEVSSPFGAFLVQVVFGLIVACSFAFVLCLAPAAYFVIVLLGGQFERFGFWVWYQTCKRF